MSESITNVEGAVRELGAPPVPVGPEPLSAKAARIRLAQYGERTAAYSDATEKALHEIALTLLAEVDRLESERHETNESLSEAAEALRANRDRIAELEAAQPEVLRRTVRWRLEVLENDYWWDCGLSAEKESAAEHLLARERAEKPGVGFRLICRTTTDTLPGKPSQVLREDADTESDGAR